MERTIEDLIEALENQVDEATLTVNDKHSFTKTGLMIGYDVNDEDLYLEFTDESYYLDITNVKVITGSEKKSSADDNTKIVDFHIDCYNNTYYVLKMVIAA